MAKRRRSLLLYIYIHYHSKLAINILPQADRADGNGVLVSFHFRFQELGRGTVKVTIFDRQDRQGGEKQSIFWGEGRGDMGAGSREEMRDRARGYGYWGR